EEVGALAKLGTLYLRLGNRTSGEERFARAVEVARRIPDRFLESQALAEWTASSLLFNDPRRTVELANELLPLSRSLPDEHSEALALAALGRAQVDLPDLDAAVANLHTALDIFQRLRDANAEANTLGYLGIAHYCRG